MIQIPLGDILDECYEAHKSSNDVSYSSIYASTLRTPYIIVTTCRSSPYPVSTPQTLEPEWCSLVVAFLALVQGAVVVAFLILLVLAPLAPLVAGVVRRL